LRRRSASAIRRLPAARRIAGERRRGVQQRADQLALAVGVDRVSESMAGLALVQIDLAGSAQFRLFKLVEFVLPEIGG